jgi:hypothetical protein
LLRSKSKHAHTDKYLNVHGSIFLTAKTWKQAAFSSADEWGRKMWYIPTMKCYLVLKRCSTNKIISKSGNRKKPKAKHYSLHYSVYIKYLGRQIQIGCCLGFRVKARMNYIEVGTEHGRTFWWTQKGSKAGL